MFGTIILRWLLRFSVVLPLTVGAAWWWCRDHMVQVSRELTWPTSTVQYALVGYRGAMTFSVRKGTALLPPNFTNRFKVKWSASLNRTPDPPQGFVFTNEQQRRFGMMHAMHSATCYATTPGVPGAVDFQTQWLIVPFSPVMTASLAPLLVYCLVLGWIRLRAHASWDRYCPRCGYDLYGSPGQCPECGLKPRRRPLQFLNRGDMETATKVLTARCHEIASRPARVLPLPPV